MITCGRWALGGCLLSRYTTAFIISSTILGANPSVDLTLRKQMRRSLKIYSLALNML